MLGKIAKKLFGSANDRYLAKLQPTVHAINALDAEYSALSNEALQAKTQEFRDRLEKGEKLDSLLPEAFATVREAAKRTLGLKHYDVQLIGGMVLNNNSIAEMKTGEGKTLVATLAAYLNALPGKGVHVVTVNDYLAQRDAETMAQVYGFLGLTVGIIVPGKSDEERRFAYNCDITYATNNELGFDYLRDNMKYHPGEMVQRPFHYAIVDEVDSILIDEARTPLIISGPTDDKTDLYIQINELIGALVDEDYEIDEKSKNVSLTEEGAEHVEQLLAATNLLKSENLYDYENTAIVHHVDQALKANKMFSRDKDYIVKDGKVIVIDEHTGRMLDGRRWSGGLHQAIEAKEGVAIQPENQTLASITFQNFFRMYPKLSGMTGTAATEAEEFGEIYSLGVVEIPTNVPVARIDSDDEFYRTAAAKNRGLIAIIKEAQERGQPVLVGTVSIEKSEALSALLAKQKIPHKVLNARFHEQEAEIVAQAGRFGSVTIATNMAGRGTDIQLGGNLEMRLEAETAGIEDPAELEAARARIKAEVAEERARVLDAGGLYVIGTERHDSRRIDNQLRGRSGRQGDPGRSSFFLSLEDDLMRIFGPQRMDAMLSRIGLEEDEAIAHPWLNKAIATAQKKVEARNYDIRKHLVKYDDVMNDQRKVVYGQRRDIMDADDLSETVREMRHETIENIVSKRIPPKSYPDTWDLKGLKEDVARIFATDFPIDQWANEEGADEEHVLERLTNETDKLMAAKAIKYGAEFWRSVEKSILLQIIDQEWKDHLANLDHLRQGVSLRSFAQRDPLNEYKTEAFSLFQEMLAHNDEQVTSILGRLELAPSVPPESLKPTPPQHVIENHIDPITGENEMADRPDPNNPSTWGDVPRNAMCPCGSGEKYKHCHGQVAAAVGPNLNLSPSPAKQQAQAEAFDKVGRNEACPCGSGQKFKHCHGRIA